MFVTTDESIQNQGVHDVRLYPHRAQHRHKQWCESLAYTHTPFDYTPLHSHIYFPVSLSFSIQTCYVFMYTVTGHVISGLNLSLK